MRSTGGASQDGLWVYKATADNSFFRDYGKKSPKEDWSTMWEAYYHLTNGTLPAADIIRLLAKLNAVATFIASQRT